MAVDMFLDLGAGADGESLDTTFAGKIDILAWSWGASNSGTSHMGGGSGAGKANFQDISITKYIDKASPIILQKVATGDHIDVVNMYVRRAGGSQIKYLQLELKQVLITSYSTGGSGGEDRLTENLTLNFAEYTMTYTPQKADGSADTDVPTNYNIAKNTM